MFLLSGRKYKKRPMERRGGRSSPSGTMCVCDELGSEGGQNSIEQRSWETELKEANWGTITISAVKKSYRCHTRQYD